MKKLFLSLIQMLESVFHIRFDTSIPKFALTNARVC